MLSLFSVHYSLTFKVCYALLVYVDNFLTVKMICYAFVVLCLLFTDCKSGSVMCLLCSFNFFLTVRMMCLD